MSYTQFKEEFDKDYKDLDDFADKCDYDLSLLPYNGFIVESNHEDFDSYGQGLEKIKTIICFKDFNVFVEFKSTKQDFNNIIWDSMKEVRLTTKTTQVYE